MKIPRSIMGLCCVVLLSACGSGGGGGDSAPAAPVPQSFPLRGAFSALFANGETKTFAVSGTCNGTATFAQAATVGGANFNNVAGQLSATRTVALTLTNCVLPSSNGIVGSTVYYDTNYAPLGYDSSPNPGYGVFLAPAAMPESGKVGDVGNLGTLTNYKSSAKTEAVGQTKSSYLVEADSASSASCAIVTVIGRDFNVSDVLQTTEQDRYRIGLTGAATLISIDIQTANGLIHLIFK